MSYFKRYIKVSITEIRPYVFGENFYMNWGDYPNTSVSSELTKAGHPKVGDMVCRDIDNHDDQWLITEKYFKENYTAEAPSKPRSNAHIYYIDCDDCNYRWVSEETSGYCPGCKGFRAYDSATIRF